VNVSGVNLDIKNEARVHQVWCGSTLFDGVVDHDVMVGIPEATNPVQLECRTSCQPDAK
jgi:hypothetical protein